MASELALQLPLPFRHRPDYTALAFRPHAGVADAMAWLARPDWPGGRLALWGDAGSGKTHLLHRTGFATAVPGAWPTADVAIDDADRMPEAALLHLLNAAAEAGHRVLLAARPPPARWPVALPDLQSRLRAMNAVELRAGDDAFRRALLGRLLSDRQLSVADSVQEWLLTCLPRDAGAMREAAARLDHAALAANRAITRPFASGGAAGDAS